MKIYTKTGDQGQTGLPGGVRIGKDHGIVEVCGTVDELNSALGLVRAGEIPGEVGDILGGVQNDLFDLGARVAMCLAPTAKLPVLSAARIEVLESAIDAWQEQLPPLTAFILPDGAVDACRIHLARAICRRAERGLVALQRTSGTAVGTVTGTAAANSAGDKRADAEPVGEKVSDPPSLTLETELIFLNRLSDLLFVAARLVNRHLGRTETLWTPAKS